VGANFCSSPHMSSILAFQVNCFDSEKLSLLQEARSVSAHETLDTIFQVANSKMYFPDREMFPPLFASVSQVPFDAQRQTFSIRFLSFQAGSGYIIYCGCSYMHHRTCLTAVLRPAGLGQLAPLLLLSLVLHPNGCTGSTRLEDERRELSIHPDYLP
jgi:hypothetical protein